MLLSGIPATDRPASPPKISGIPGIFIKPGISFIIMPIIGFTPRFSFSKSSQAALRSASVSSSSDLFSRSESCSWYVTIQSFLWMVSSARRRSFGRRGVGRRKWLSGSKTYNSLRSAELKWRSICCSSTTRHDNESFVT